MTIDFYWWHCRSIHISVWKALLSFHLNTTWRNNRSSLWSPKPYMITPTDYSDSSSCHTVSFSQESSRHWLSCSFLNMLLYTYLRIFPLTLPFAWISLHLGFLTKIAAQTSPTILSKPVPLSYSHNQFYSIFIALTIFCYMFVYGLSPRLEYKRLNWDFVPGPYS